METEVSGSLVTGEVATGLPDVNVVSAAAKWILKRPTVGDVVLEIPRTFASCGYDVACSNADYHTLPFTVQNTGSEMRALSSSMMFPWPFSVVATELFDIREFRM